MDSEPLVEVSENVKQMTAAELATYLQHKAQGGRNFEKGDRYETRFAVKKIAEKLTHYLTRSTSFKAVAQFEGSFVDDLVIEDSTAIEHFQLKNTQSQYWGSGKKGSLLFDFFHENVRLQSRGKPFKLSLVVSDETSAERLDLKRPIDLPAETKVAHYPDVNLFQLIKQNHLRSELAGLSRKVDARDDDLMYLARALMARWCDRDGECSAEDLLDNTVRRFMRSLHKGNPEDILVPEVKQILNGIPGFKYTVSRGFLQYHYKGTSQVLAFDVFDERFKTVQEWIRGTHPSTFPGNFEDMLMTWSEIA